MRIFFDDTGSQTSETILILSKKESDALIDILAVFEKSKPNKRSNAAKMADQLNDRLLA